jgi:hypothetical protein
MNPLHESPAERVERALNLYPEIFCLAEVVASRAMLPHSLALRLLEEMANEGRAESIKVKIDGKKAKKAFRCTD